MKAILDLHTHTIVSGHAFSTVKENIEFASKRDIKYLGISDHAPNMPGGPHKFYFQNLKVIPREVEGVKVLRGIEGNIIDLDGNLDIDKDLYSGVDYVIASLHPPCVEAGTKEENTNAQFVNNQKCQAYWCNTKFIQNDGCIQNAEMKL